MTSDHLTPSGEIAVTTEDETASYLLNFGNVDLEAGRGYGRFAVEARRLFGGPTPEEKAVLEAADVITPWLEAMLGRSDYYPAMDDPARLVQAVRALRASREPKPRYRVVCDKELDALHRSDCWGVADAKREYMVTRRATQEDAERIARLLNEADKP